jgi:hypothetical protein
MESTQQDDFVFQNSILPPCWFVGAHQDMMNRHRRKIESLAGKIRYYTSLRSRALLCHNPTTFFGATRTTSSDDGPRERFTASSLIRAVARQKAEQVAAKLEEMKLADAAEHVQTGIEETLGSVQSFSHI